ncbi:MAG: hypothetical protein FWH31_10430 [Streptococcaceae bacterium]|nr:hypothetical protein [Streptococcaceae bacterium]
MAVGRNSKIAISPYRFSDLGRMDSGDSAALSLTQEVGVLRLRLGALPFALAALAVKQTDSVAVRWR